MSTQPKINKEAVKTLVVAYGQREAARRAGINENTVRSWCMRYGWGKQAQPSNTDPQPIRNQDPADALRAVLASDNEATRIAWSKAGRKAAEHFSKLKPSVSKDRAAAAKNWHSVAAGTHGWREREGSDGFTLNVLNLGSLGIQVRQDESVQSG